MSGSIKLLDCTLRDGAHLNHGNFGHKMITETISDLNQANVDIIEVGFFDNEEHDEDSTFFSSIADVKKILPAIKGNSKLSLMADFVDVSQIEPYDGTVEYFRLSFKRHRLEWGLNAAKILMEKGYKCFINPVNCNVYSDQEYLEVIRKVNELKPFGFSIVDTFGVFRKMDLARIYYLLDSNLDPDITIGLHLHENLGLAYSLAQYFLEIRNPKRNITIDCSLLGMGRAPGNLCAEQIMDHLNFYYGTDYNTEPALDAIDDYIVPLKQQYPWGYSIPYALSGKYGIHRTYAEFLMGKKRLKTKDIQRILSLIDKDHIEMFDQDYIEGLYRSYVNIEYDDKPTIDYLSRRIENRAVLVLCPGKSISDYKDRINKWIEDNNALVFAVNFEPEDIKADYVFCANAKRINNLDDNSNYTRIITSNLLGTVNNFDFAVSFNNCVYFNETFCEDSTLMLFKVLINCGCDNLYVAGFDGFDEGKDNYYKHNYTNEQGTHISVKMVKSILDSSLSTMHLNFLTPSMYAEQTID